MTPRTVPVSNLLLLEKKEKVRKNILKNTEKYRRGHGGGREIENQISTVKYATDHFD